MNTYFFVAPIVSCKTNLSPFQAKKFKKKSLISQPFPFHPGYQYNVMKTQFFIVKKL